MKGASSGDVAGFEAVAKGHALIVPTGYVSGTALSGTAVAPNETLSSIGITPGVYTWTYGAGGADTLTIDVAAPLPEPTSHPIAVPINTTARCRVLQVRATVVNACANV